MRRFLSALFLLVFLLPASLPARAGGAGQKPPTQLVPPPLEEDSAPAEPPPPKQAEFNELLASELEENALKPPPLGSIGLLESNQPPWDENLWQGADPLFVLSLLKNSPLRDATSALGLVEAKLLLQTAPPPQDLNELVFFYRRLERLLAMGKDEEVKVLLDMAMPTASSNPLPPLLKIRERLALSGYDMPSACTASELLAEGAAELFSLKLKIICQALAGEVEQAELSFAVFLERFADEVTADNYIRLAAALLGQGEKPQKATATADLLELALIKLLEIQPGDSFYPQGVVCRMLFLNPNGAPAARFRNGLCAVAKGAMPLALLRQFIAAYPSPSAEQLAAAKPQRASGRLSLLKALTDEDSPATERTAIAARLLAAADSPLVASVLLRLLEENMPANNPTLATLLARLYYLEGEPQKALEYSDDDSLLPWRYLADQADKGEIDDWMRRRLVASTDSARTLYQLRLFYAAAEASGRSLGAESWWPVLIEAYRGLVTEGEGITEARPDLLLWLAPERSQGFGLRVLSSLALPSHLFPNGLSPLTLGHTAHYWLDWGLEEEAHLLLRQAIFAAGL